MPETGNDPLEMFRRLWGPLGVPVPGLAMPTLDPAEIDKRITELKTVEGWLGMNLNMLRMVIQSLEMQKATLQTLRAATGVAAEPTPGPPPPMPWPWEAMQQAMNAAAAAARPSTDSQRKEDPKS